MKRFLGLLLALLLASPVCAVTPNSIVTAQTPTRGLVQFLQGTDTAGTYKTLYTAVTAATKCFGMWETNNDATATHVVTLQVVNTSVKYGLEAFTTGLGDGLVTGVPAKNVFSPINLPGLPSDSDNNPYIILQSGDTLQATFATALTATDLINLEVVCADF